MTGHDFYDRIKGVFQKKAESDKRIQMILKRIESGKATFADTAEYSQLVSELLGSTLSEHLGAETTAYVKEYVCREMLRDQYESMNDLLASVQRALNEKVGLRVAPQRAAFPTERVDVIAHALEDPTVPLDVIKRRAKSPVANVSKSFHDDYIKENAKFRSKAGLKCFIVRTTDGKCCDWCTAMAGRYEYGSEPHDVYRRHDNCGCTVIYESGRQRQDVWTKKTWEVPESAKKKYEPVRLSTERAKALQQAKLLQYRGLTSGEKQIAAIKSSDELTFPRIDNAPQIDKRFAEEFRREYESFTDIFGKLPSLRNVNVGVYNNDNIFGHYNPNSREITLFGIGGKSGKNAISNIALQNKKNGQWSTASPFHSFRHELGHELQEELRLNDPLWNEKITEIEKIRDSFVDRLTNLDDSDKIELMKNRLSVYAFKDTGEFISECVAEYANSPKKARSTAKSVVEILLRKGN